MFSDLTLTNILIVIVCLLVSMTVHEFMHAYVGLKLGDTTAMVRGRVSFNPLDHIDPIMTIVLPVVTILLFHAPILAAKPVPFDPRNLKYGEYGAAMLAAAGPLSNLALAILGALVLRLAGPGSLLETTLVFFVELNVALFVFNMIPIPPLDGSRVFYAFAPDAIRDLFDQIEPYGFMIIILLIVVGGGAVGNILTNLNSFVLNLLP